MRRASEIRLQRAFSQALAKLVATTATAAVGAGALVACGGATSNSGTVNADGGTGPGPAPDGGVAPSAFTTACGLSSSTTLLSGMTAEPPIDGAVRRYEQAYFGVLPEDGDQWTKTDSDKTGDLCSKATDRTGCLAKVDGFRILPGTRSECVKSYGGYYGSDSACGTSYILYTRGDEIGVARNDAETRALIGHVDTFNEALWVASTQKLELNCTDYDKVPKSQYRGALDGGYDMKLVTSDCGKPLELVTIHIDPQGNVTELSRENAGVTRGCPVAGRRPEGYCANDHDLRYAAGAVGAHLAMMSALEAASVIAFRRLHRQLAEHGAPSHLLERVRKAAGDEVRHARATGNVAKKYGASTRTPDIAPESNRLPSLFAIALENAREGCVRETFGALVAHLQAQRAADMAVRECMITIAEEETQHAALSWDIAEWIETQLTAEERQRIAEERREALRTLAHELTAPLESNVQRDCGLPAPHEALSMLSEIAPMLLAG